MIVFLLLVIIAILLLGASRFLGAISAIAGFVVLVLAVFSGFAVIAAVFDSKVEDVIFPTILVLFAVAIGIWLWLDATRES